MLEVCFELPAFAKVVLHATKYPALGINGLLIRKVGSGSGGSGSGGKGKGGGGGGEESKHQLNLVQDAVPLLHMSKFLTPTLEIALAQVEQHCKQTKSEVVGYYQANEIISDNTPDFVTLRIAEKLTEVYPGFIVVMVNNDQLDSNLEAAPFTVYQMTDGKLKVKEARVRLEPDQQGALSTVSALIQAKAYRNLIDFDNHLDDLGLDYWTNPEVSESIQQFNS